MIFRILEYIRKPIILGIYRQPCVYNVAVFNDSYDPNTTVARAVSC